MPPEPSVTSACEEPRSCTLRYSSALLPKSFERPGPKSVSPATYCSGVEVVVWWRWISVCVIVVLLFVEHCRKRIMQLALHPETIERKQCEGQNRAACSAKCRTMSRRPRGETLFGGWRLLPVLINAEPLDLRLQRLPWDTEFRRRAGRSRDAAMGLRESRFDHFDFTICQRRKALVRPRRLC